MAKTKEQVIERAKSRINSVEYSKARILTKIKDLPNDPRQEAWKKRLTEYEKSLEHLAIELKHGRNFPIKGMPSENGVSVDIPTGEVKAKGI